MLKPKAQKELRRVELFVVSKLRNDYSVEAMVDTQGATLT